MQERPIDHLNRHLAAVALGLGRVALGLFVGLGVIGLSWATAMHPAAATGPMVVAPVYQMAKVQVGPLAGPLIAQTRLAAPLGAGEMQANPSPVAASPVCRIEIDTAAPDPLATGCAPLPASVTPASF